MDVPDFGSGIQPFLVNPALAKFLAGFPYWQISSQLEAGLEKIMIFLKINFF